MTATGLSHKDSISAQGGWPTHNLSPHSHFGCPIHTRSLRMSGVEGARDYDTLMPSHLKRYQTGGSDHFITFSCYRRPPISFSAKTGRARLKPGQ